MYFISQRIKKNLSKGVVSFKTLNLSVMYEINVFTPVYYVTESRVHRNHDALMR